MGGRKFSWQQIRPSRFQVVAVSLDYVDRFAAETTHRSISLYVSPLRIFLMLCPSVSNVVYILQSVIYRWWKQQLWTAKRKVTRNWFIGTVCFIVPCGSELFAKPENLRHVSPLWTSSLFIGLLVLSNVKPLHLA